MDLINYVRGTVMWDGLERQRRNICQNLLMFYSVLLPTSGLSAPLKQTISTDSAELGAAKLFQL